MWNLWLDEALEKLEKSKLLLGTQPISSSSNPSSVDIAGMQFYDGPRPSDRAWIDVVRHSKKVTQFSVNDYLGLACHPAVKAAAIQAIKETGMGPKGAPMLSGYTHYHQNLESALARLKSKEAAVLCPSGFSANTAVITAIGSISSLLSASGGKPTEDEKVAIFSDSLNHASIIDGIRLAERVGDAKCFVYKHCDMDHLEKLLSSSNLKRKLVITDSLFSMDGDFAPMVKIAALRRKYGFLLLIDDAHGTLVCGENGGGVGEMFHVEKDIDICVGTLSKAIGSHGGFIASSEKWKSLIISRGRSFIFSTSISTPAAAAAYASLMVANEEKWRRKEIWKRVKEFNSATGMNFQSQIIPWIIGDIETSVKASKFLSNSGIYAPTINPPFIPVNLCRLRITLSAAHTTTDITALTSILAQFMKMTENNPLST